MIQTLGKILVILLVCALVAGGLYALVQGTGANRATPAAGQQFDSRSAGNRPARSEGFREHAGRNEASLGRGLGGLLVSLLQIGAITFIVLQVQKVLAKSTKPNAPDPA